MTLVELLVVLALLGVILGMSGLALASLQPSTDAVATAALRRARADAVRSGAPRAVQGVLFLPDGRAIGVGVDPLTGAPDAW